VRVKENPVFIVRKDRVRYRKTRVRATASVMLAAAGIWMGTRCVAQERAPSGVAETPGCEGLDARGCLDRAIAAMGGREKLAAIKTEQLDVIGHTELMEQSYRQDPFITSYARELVVVV
jgi:hypothetical protein